MARNEDGEFELMLGNKQLLSVFFLMVLLLCLCFVGGYLLGRSAAPVLNAANQPSPPPISTPAPSSTSTTTSPKSEPAKASEPAPTTTKEPEAKAPIRTAPQVSDKAPEPVKEPPPAPKQVAKAEPPAKAKAEPPAKAKAEPPAAKSKSTPPSAKQAAATKQDAKQAPASGQPVAGRIYLQLSATDKDKADVMVDLLRRKNFAGMAAPVAERPGLFRVLVGPLAENALTETKAQLKASGFPGDQAIRRVF